MNATRRELLRKAGLAGSLITIPAVAGTVINNRAEANECTAPADDAELIRLGEEFDRLYVEWLPLEAEHAACARLRDKAWKTGGFKFSTEAYNACCEWAGVTAAEAAEAPVLDRLDDLAERILALPARTFGGVAVKLRVVRFCAFGAQQAHDEIDDLNWDVRCLVLVQRDVEALAAGGGQ